jgi:hypothetical protein
MFIKSDILIQLYFLPNEERKQGEKEGRRKMKENKEEIVLFTIEQICFYSNPRLLDNSQDL